MLRGMRRVVLLVYPGVQSVDVAGPAEALAAAGGYRVEVVAPSPGAIPTQSALRLHVDRTLREVEGHVDLLVVAGGQGVREAVADHDLVADLRRVAAESDRVTSVCTGAFLLAEAGLLEGRRATTHWSTCELLADSYPDVDVDADAIYVRDGEIWTSAGVTAGIDMTLAIIQADLGPAAALQVARRMVVFLTRPGGQSQFSAQLEGQFAAWPPLRELQAHIVEHPEDDLSVERLAERLSMSPRHLSRSFTRELGTTPARYVERVRVEAARRLLEQTTDPVEHVATRCGFGTPETLRRAFLRVLGTTPTGYRRRFHPVDEEIV